MQNKVLFTLGISLLVGLVSCQSQQTPQEVGMYCGSVKVEATDSMDVILTKAANLRPTPRQLEAIENEFIAFLHFGPNTFSRREWGTGFEDPALFDLKELHTDQWCEAMKAAGMKMAILTVKHHDGFCLWQSRYTQHGIMSTGFQDGKGDVLRDLVASCQKYGLKVGIYLSPADLFQIENPAGLYGNLSPYTKRTIPRQVPERPFQNKTTFEFEVDDYNEYFLNQLFELLTEYGPISEVWFDGAHPKTKGGQQYNYSAWRTLIRTLAPQATIFGREDIRWCGNEGGGTRDAEFNVVTFPQDPSTMTVFKDMYGGIGTREVYAQREKPYYLHYEPAETNTSIRAGWFYRDDETQEIRTADDVFDIYERAVGGNSIFLLNIPPNREGKFSDRDVAVLREVGQRIEDTYSLNLLQKGKGPRALFDDKQETYVPVDSSVVLSTKQPITFNRLALREPIGTVGERVERHAVDAFVDGAWQEIAQGTNIGNKCILRFPEVTTSRIRIRILETRAPALLSSVSAYHYQTRPPQLTATQDSVGMVALEPYSQHMRWNYRATNASKNINAGYKIYYTVDGSEPSASSTLYTEPFFLENATLKAVAVVNDQEGPLLDSHIGWSKRGWTVTSGKDKALTLDLGRELTIKGFAYTPQHRAPEGPVEKGMFRVSEDGRRWRDLEPFEFGNIVNDPSRRTHYLQQPVTNRYIQLPPIRDVRAIEIF